MKDGFIYYRTPDGRRWRESYTPSLLASLRERGFNVEKVKTLNGRLLRPLYDFQLSAVAHFQRRGGFVLADEMGLGKTLTSIACAESISAQKVLIACPANVKYQWEREIRKSLARKVQIMVCEGRRVTQASTAYMRFSDVVIINYEVIAYWRVSLSAFRWDVVIVDEAHRVKKSKSICTKALKRLRDVVGKTICLTGTPMTDRNADLWNVVSLADRTIFPSEFRFQERYCSGVGSFGKIGGSVNTDELHHILVNSGVMLRRRKADVFKELPKVTHTVIPLNLNSAGVKEAEADAMNAASGIKGTTGVDLSRGVMNLRAKIERFRQETLKAKMPHIVQWIRDFLEGNDQKLMVAVIHKDAGGRLLHNYFKDCAVIIDGSLSSREKDEAKTRFIEDSPCRVLIGNILSVGTGTDGLQGVCSDLLYAELDWSPAVMNQCTARLDRHGQKSPVSVTYLTVKDSIEEFLARTLDRKAEILASVLDGRTVSRDEQLMHLMHEYGMGRRS